MLPVHADDADDDIRDAQPLFLRDEWYSEGWDQLFYFSDGTFLAVQISILNVGFGSHHAGVLGLLVPPEGETLLLRNSRSHREWEFSEDKFSIEVAGHRLYGSHPDYHIRLRKKEGEIDVDFRAQAAPWRQGKFLQTHRDYAYLSFFAPLADASARYRKSVTGEIADAPWVVLDTGRGFAARYVYSTGLNDLIRSTTRVVALEQAGPVPVMIVSRDTEGGLLTRLALFENERLLHQTEGFAVDVGNRVETAEGDEREIPASFTFNYEDPEFSLKGTMRVDKFIVRFDPVDHIKPLIRTLVRFLNTPIQYRYLGSYDLTYTSGQRTVRMQGKTLIDHTTMRHEKKEQDRRAR